LAQVQCVSFATSKRTFRIQNLIKTQVRNNFCNRNLEIRLKFALKGPNEEFDHIIDDAIPLWDNESKYGTLNHENSELS